MNVAGTAGFESDSKRSLTGHFAFANLASDFDLVLTGAYSQSDLDFVYEIKGYRWVRGGHICIHNICMSVVLCHFPECVLILQKRIYPRVINRFRIHA